MVSKKYLFDNFFMRFMAVTSTTTHIYSGKTENSGSRAAFAVTNAYIILMLWYRVSQCRVRIIDIYFDADVLRQYGNVVLNHLSVIFKLNNLQS